MDAFTIVFVIFAVVILGLKFAYYKATGDKEGLKSERNDFLEEMFEDMPRPGPAQYSHLYDDD